MPPAPDRAPEKVTLLPPVSKVAPSAPMAIWADMSAMLPLAHCRPPPFNVIRPVPRLAAVEKLIRPPITVVPPL